MDASCVQRHHQEIMMASPQSLENMMMAHTARPPQLQMQVQNQQQKQEMEEKKAKTAAATLAPPSAAAPEEGALKCPRCDSSNTKFCYYNNYSLTQPRYFCKSCRRYWTKGGTLRNVPVGGGCRKNKRCSSSSSLIKRNHHDFITTTTSSSSSPPNHHFSPQLLASFDSNNTHPSYIGDFVGNLPFLGGNNATTHFDLFNNGGNNLCYYGDNNVNLMDEQEHHQQQMGMHFDLLQLHHHHQQQQEVIMSSTSNPSSGSSTPTTIKQEIELGDHGNRLLLNYIMNGGGDDAPKESWNGGVLGSTSWHNLINSPLM